MTTSLVVLLVVLAVVVGQTTDVKIRFDDLPNRRVSNPDDSYTTRRTFWAPRDALCRTVGASAGALIAHRLTTSGSVSDGERLPGHSLLDLHSFVTLTSLTLTNRLEVPSSCSRNLLKSAAIEMCRTIICGSNGEEITRDQSIAIALSTYGVLDAIPTMRTFRQKLKQPRRDCYRKLYNLKLTNSIDFHRNPQQHIYKIIDGLDEEVLEIRQILKAANAKPLDIPPIAPYGHEEYMEAAVQGTVIASHLIKSIMQSGRVTTVKKLGSYDAALLIARSLCRIIRALKISQLHLAYRTHNIALKMTLYWIINNWELAGKFPTGHITLVSLKNLGLAAYFPQSLGFETNDEIVRPHGKFLEFSDAVLSLDIIAILIRRISVQKLTDEISLLLPTESVTIPDEVIAMEVIPVPGTADFATHASDLVNTYEGGIGALPDPSEWFAIDAPAKNATHKASVVYMGTLAAVVGTHASRLIPQMGLVTRHEQSGYRNMTHVNLYKILQTILQQLIGKLMTVIPMSLDEGFYMLNGAFKSAKLSINMLNFDETSPKMMIPLALKHYDLLQFYPQLQHIKWELWPVPSTSQVLYLWAKPGLGVNLTLAMDEKINKLANELFPTILKDIIEIMQQHMPELSFYNLKELPGRSGNFFKWDPPNSMSFLYDPETMDGVSADNFALIDAPHTPIECPGHIFCPPQPCKKSGCGHYACDSQHPWCYYPPGIQCPGSITCPVFVYHDEQLIDCPADPECPIVQVQCPGRSECPDESTLCPGSPSCPLSIKCPGILCPSRYTSRPQILLPCPLHPSCSRPNANQVACANDQTCEYASKPDSQSEVAAAIKEAGANIANTINNKESVVQINNSAISQVTVTGANESAPEASATAAASSQISYHNNSHAPEEAVNVAQN